MKYEFLMKPDEVNELAEVTEKLAVKCREENRDLTDAEVAELSQAIDNFKTNLHKASPVRGKLRTLRGGWFSVKYKRPEKQNPQSVVTDEEKAQLLAAISAAKTQNEKTVDTDRTL